MTKTAKTVQATLSFAVLVLHTLRHFKVIITRANEKNWRLALKHALGDVAYNEKPTRNYRKQLASSKQSGQSVSLSLFGD